MAYLSSDLFVLSLISLVAILARVPFLAFPMDEDFGFYAYVGHFRKRGLRLVKDFWGVFFPWVIFLKTGMYKICRGNIKCSRLLFSLYNALTAISVFFLASRLFGKGPGVLAAVLYSVFSAAPSLGSCSTHAEKYYLLPVTLSVLCFLHGMDRGLGLGWIIFSGMLLGTAFALKPVNFVHLPLFSLYLWLYGGGEEAASYVSGFFFAVLINFGVIITVFRKEIRPLWIQNKLRIMAALNHIGKPLDILERMVTDFFPLFRETLFIWVSFPIFLYFAVHEKNQAQALLLLWVAASIIILIGQRAFWNYQYIPLVHVFCMASAAAAPGLIGRLGKENPFDPIGPGIVFLFLLSSLLYSMKNLFPYYLPGRDWKKLLNRFRKMDQYLHVPEIGKYIRNNSSESDYIYVWGPWTQLYLLADRPSCEKSAFHFIPPFQEIHEIQYDETIKGIIEKKPRFIVQIYSNFHMEKLNDLTGLAYELDRVIFNRYPVYRLAEKKGAERLYKEDEDWDAKKGRLEKLTEGARGHKVYSFYLDGNNEERYLKEFEEALQVNPYDVAALVHIGIYHRSLLNFEKSLDYLKMALVVNKDVSGIRLEMAHLYKAMEKDVLYEEELKKAKRRIVPFNASSWIRWGIIHRLLGNFEKSIKILKFLPKISNTVESLYFELGVSCREAGRPQEAIEYIEKELALYPNGEWKYFNLGLACREAGRPQEAIEYIEKELAMYPRGEWKHFHLGLVCREAGRPLEAIEHIEKELALYPNGEWKHFHLGMAHKEAGMLEQAREWLLSEIKRYPAGEWKQYELGLLYQKMERLDDAISCFEKELESFPGKPYVHYLAASLLKTKGDLEKARKHFEVVVRSDASEVRDKAGGHYHIGSILMAKNKNREAAAEFRKCLQLLPDHKMAAKQLDLIGVEP
ncbi:MAG: tetratricopeptide repeat protein [Nitrospinae bacterium]|nr:tetratricopeptide repeat protein [Nitrospinota bacterium]